MEREFIANGYAAWPRTGLILVALSLVLTLLNATKPVTVDDSVYYLLAAHIAEHPLDPYGFKYYDLLPANECLAPPVFNYWYALGISLFGHDVVLAKFWLLPVSMLLVFCLHAVGRRFARGMEMPFVFFVVLSPAVLPCLNLMLDLPAIALSLAAILLFMRACETNSLTLTLATGLIAGIATQTKYTSFVATGVIVLHGLRTGHWRRAGIVASMASAIFVGWEMLMLWRYGDSHFWLGYTQFRPSTGGKVRLIQPLFGYLGSMMAACIPLYLAVARWPARVVWTSAALVLGGFALVAFLPFSAFAAMGEALSLRGWPVLSSVMFGFFGAAVLGTFTANGWRLMREPLDDYGLPSRSWLFSVDGFLVLWLITEIAGYFLLSPYPAARRIIGIVIPGVLLAFRLAARTCPERAGLIWGIGGISLVLGLLAFAVDFSEPYGRKVLAQQLALECREKAPSAKIWFFGDGAFELYGEPAGMKRLLAYDIPIATGDWVLVVDELHFQYAKHPVAERCVAEEVREWDWLLPLRSQYQVGGVAMMRREKASVRVTVYRVQ